MNESTATRYQRLRRRADATSLATGTLLTAGLALTPGARVLAGWADSFARGLGPTARHAVALAALVVLLVALWEIAALPVVIYTGLRIERRFRRAGSGVDDILIAQAHGALIALPAALYAAFAVALGTWIAPTWWWAAAGVLIAGGLVGAARAIPAVLPLMGDTRPIGRPRLAADLAGLAARARTPVAAIDEWRLGDADRLTALVAGIGRTRRVFLSSEILRDWTDDEIAVVVAHELSHHRHHDLWRTIALDAAVISAGLWAAGALLARAATGAAPLAPNDLAALPAIALAAGAVWLIATPLRLAQSRAHERRADRFALELTGRPDAFGAAVRRLGARRLAEERPSRLTRWLYHRHPSMDERLAYAERFQTRRLGAQATAARRG